MICTHSLCFSFVLVMLLCILFFVVVFASFISEGTLGWRAAPARLGALRLKIIMEGIYD
jgi:hypothetical protein